MQKEVVWGERLRSSSMNSSSEYASAELEIVYKSVWGCSEIAMKSRSKANMK